MLGLVLTLALATGKPARPTWPVAGNSPVLLPWGPAASDRLATYLNVSNGVASMYGVTFTRNSAATCTDASGNVTKLGNNVACTAGGYHVRPQTSNLLTNSETFGSGTTFQGAWAKAGTGTVTFTVGDSTCGTAPDGTNNATRVDCSGTGSCALLQTSTAAAASWASVWIKKASNNASAVNIGLGTDTSGAHSVALTSAWQRASYSSGNTTSVQWSLGYNNTWTPTTGGICIWGAQLETSAFANDYCPSASTPGTCAAEVATVATPPGMSMTEGCAAWCEASPFAGANPLASVLALLSGNSSGTARLGYVPASAQSVAISDGTHTATLATTFSSGARRCFRSSWSASVGTLTVADVTGGTSASASGFTGFASFDSTLGIGQEGGGKEPLGGVVDQVVLGSSAGGCR